MTERIPTADEWQQAESRATAKKTYASHVCPFCGRTIREGAWGGRSTNYDKHINSCSEYFQRPTHTS